MQRLPLYHPCVGHIHVTVNDAPWRWADTSGEPLILNGFPPGPHNVMVELVDPKHRVLVKALASFVIPNGTEPGGHR